MEQVDLQDCDAALRKWESIKSWSLEANRTEINEAASDNKALRRRGDKTNDWQEWLDEKDSGLDWNRKPQHEETQSELKIKHQKLKIKPE